MCGFCHAPEDAYDALLGDPTLDRSGLCPEALERLRMAAAPQPAYHPRLEHAWNQERHEYVVLREWGSCERCDALTWKWGNEQHKPHVCRACVEETVNVYRSLHGHFLDEPLSEEDEADLRSLLPREGEAPMRLNFLRLSDYPVPHTRLFEHLKGSRYRTPRPRILFGEAARREYPRREPVGGLN